MPQLSCYDNLRNKKNSDTSINNYTPKPEFPTLFKSKSNVVKINDHSVYTLLSPHHPLLDKLCQKWKAKYNKDTSTLYGSKTDKEALLPVTTSSSPQSNKYSTPLHKKIVSSPDAEKFISPQAEKSLENISRESNNTIQNDITIQPPNLNSSQELFSDDDSEIILNFKHKTPVEPNVLNNKSPVIRIHKYVSSPIQNVKKHLKSSIGLPDGEAGFGLEKQDTSRKCKAKLQSQTNTFTTIPQDASFSANEVTSSLLIDDSALTITFPEASKQKTLTKASKGKDISSSQIIKEVSDKTQEHDAVVSTKTASKKSDEIPSKEMFSKPQKLHKKSSSSLQEVSEFSDSNILDKAKKKYILYQWYIRPLPKSADICVEGQRRDLPPNQFWHSSAITTRLSSKILMTYSKTIYKLMGDINKEAMLVLGFPQNIIDDFEQGFPENWKESWDKIHTLFTEHQRESATKSKERRKSSRIKDSAQVTPNTNHVSFLNLDDLPCTRSGRKIKPRLSYWTGERISTSTDFDVKFIVGNLADTTRPWRRRKTVKQELFSKTRSHSRDYLLGEKKKKNTYDTDVEHKENDRERKQDSLKKVTRKVKGEKNKFSEKLSNQKYSIDERTVRKSSRRYETSDEETFSNRKSNTDLVKSETRTKHSNSLSEISGKNESKNSKDKSSNFKEAFINERLTENVNKSNDDDDEDDTDLKLKKKLINKSSTNHHQTNNSIYQMESIEKKQKHNRKEKNENIKGYKNCIDQDDMDWYSVKNVAMKDLEGNLYSDDETFHTIGNLHKSNKAKGTNLKVKTYSNKIRHKGSHHTTKTEKDDDSDTGSECFDDSTSSSQSSEGSIFSLSIDKNSGKSNKKGKKRQSSQTETKNKLNSRKRSNVTESKNSKKSKTLNQGTDIEKSDVIWSEKAISKLERIVQKLPAETPCFWNVVAERVKTHSAEECQEYYQSLNKASRTHLQTVKKKEDVILDAKPGTLKRKRQLRELLEEHNTNYEDNFFDTALLKPKTPYILQRFSFDTEDEDDKISIKTPRAREVLNKPVSEKKTPHLGSISPGILSSVNRNDIDQYISRVQKGKKGRHLIPPILEKKNNTKADSPYLKLQKYPREAGTFNLKQTGKDEKGSSDDYYFSDNSFDSM